MNIEHAIIVHKVNFWYSTSHIHNLLGGEGGGGGGRALKQKKTTCGGGEGRGGGDIVIPLCCCNFEKLSTQRGYCLIINLMLVYE